jgi:hypothetical protein
MLGSLSEEVPNILPAEEVLVVVLTGYGLGVFLTKEVLVVVLADEVLGAFLTIL